MSRTLLVLNSGSSSIKFSLYGIDPLELQAHGQVGGIGGRTRLQANDHEGATLIDEPLDEDAGDHRQALDRLLGWGERQGLMGELVAAGHRVVHGGTRFHQPLRVDAALLAALEQLSPLAPLHQPHNLAGIRALSARMPELPQVACFDTAFHADQPPVAQAFALPRELTEAGIRRYGFHGLSYEYIASVLPETLGEDAARGRVVVAHLGNGASLCAMHDRRSAASTMGFTALDGLPMGTRCGTIDPGVVLYLIGEYGLGVASVNDLLYHRSGLLGVSGISNDMRRLLASDDPHAHEAIELFVYRINRELGSLTAALGGLDALVFTGGIGEHAAPVRARACELAAWLGIRLDPAANERHAACISRADSPVSVWIIPTDEERMIARHTCRILAIAD